MKPADCHPRGRWLFPIWPSRLSGHDASKPHCTHSAFTHSRSGLIFGQGAGDFEEALRGGGEGGHAALDRAVEERLTGPLLQAADGLADGWLGLLTRFSR
jgi:hypothetical protein